jgi:hypothetical protein
VQRIPAPAPLQECAQRFLRLERGHHVAGVAHDEVGFVDRGEVRIVLEHAHAHPFVAREQLQQLEAREVDVVILAAGNQYAADFLALCCCHSVPQSVPDTSSVAA